MGNDIIVLLLIVLAAEVNIKLFFLRNDIKKLREELQNFMDINHKDP